MLNSCLCWSPCLILTFYSNSLDMHGEKTFCESNCRFATDWERTISSFAKLEKQKRKIYFRSENFKTIHFFFFWEKNKLEKRRVGGWGIELAWSSWAASIWKKVGWPPCPPKFLTFYHSLSLSLSLHLFVWVFLFLLWDLSLWPFFSSKILKRMKSYVVFGLSCN